MRHWDMKFYSHEEATSPTIVLDSCNKEKVLENIGLTLIVNKLINYPCYNV
jgi:hypothetical protein